MIASLPCYTAKNVNIQRGKGVFDRSIQGLLLLNERGYGREGTGLKLDLVYNPLGKLACFVFISIRCISCNLKSLLSWRTRVKPQGTKIFQYCFCPAGRVTYNFPSS